MPVRRLPGAAGSAAGRREAPRGRIRPTTPLRAAPEARLSSRTSRAWPGDGAPSPARQGNDAEGSWAWSSRPGASSRRCRPRTAGYDPKPDSPEPGGAARQRAHGVCVRKRMPGPRPGGVHRRTSGQVRMGRALVAICAMRDNRSSSRPKSRALAAGGRCAWGVRSAPVTGAGGGTHEAVDEGLPGAHGACAQAELPLHGNGFPNRPITNASGGARQGADEGVRSEAAARCEAAAPRRARKGACRW